ncbi:MAG: hypothetical protein GY757_41070, partial [bacterium]|nr:hypothetical protein [bacterium]
TGFDYQYVYNWQDQLIEVITGTGVNGEYKYYALGRRIEKTITDPNSEDITRYVYKGYQILEERDEDGHVFKRYTYGNGIDEPVEIETDEDKDGTFNSYLPMQNTIGSVIGIADSSGNLVEKVIYTTYGTPTFLYDDEAPKVDALRTQTGTIVFRFSESVDKSTASDAIKIKKGTETIAGSIAYSDDDRVVAFTPSSPLLQGETLTVLVTVDLKDTFDNSLENEFSRDFSYAGTDAVVYDRVSPDVDAIYLRSGEFFVEFSEELHPGSIADSIDLTSSQGTLTGAVTQEDSKTLKFVPSDSLTGSIEYTINIRTSPTDLSSKGLVGVFSEAFIYLGKDEFIFEKPDPTEHKESRIGNNILFQGRNFEYETGLYYFRARYYHPELGRFLQNDPLGYQDSMNMYQAFNQNPVNFVDPMGLETKLEFRVRQRDWYQELVKSELL